MHAAVGEETLGYIKGSATLEFLVWCRRDRGDARVREALGRLMREDRAHFDFDHDAYGLLPSMWYPARVMHHALDELTRGLDDAGLADLARRAGKALVDAKMKGLQRVLFTLFVSPEKYCKLVQRAWDLNYDTGRVEQIVLSDTCQDGRVTGWRGHHAFLCRLNGEVKAELFRRMGCKDVRQGPRRCVAAGDKYCGSTLTWR
jgi:hypothetical protein